MRKSAIGTRISLILVLISAAIIIVGHIAGSGVCQNIGYGVLGSSIVSFIVMLSEYFTSKRETFEQYYLAALETNNQFLKCKYERLTRLDFALAELKWNYDAHQIIQQITQENFVDKNRTLIDEICSSLRLPNNEPRDDKMVAQFLAMFEKRDIVLRQIMCEYLSLADYKKTEFENAFGNFYFILDIKKRRKEIYSSIHSPIQEKHNEIRKQCIHIEGYLSKKITNAPVIYSYLKQAIDLLYDTKTSESGTIVYPAFTHTISDELEQLRCDIYHEEYHQTDPSPVYAGGACISDFMNKNTCVEFITKPME